MITNEVLSICRQNVTWVKSRYIQDLKKFQSIKRSFASHMSYFQPTFICIKPHFKFKIAMFNGPQERIMKLILKMGLQFDLMIRLSSIRTSSTSNSLMSACLIFALS